MFKLPSSTSTPAGYAKWMSSQPKGQPYYNAPCADFHSDCACAEPHRIANSIIVSADGACRRNGHSRAQASIGVFFKVGSPYNEAHVLPEATPTNQRAELFAAITALRAVGALIYGGDLPQDMGELGNLRLLVLKTDSEYVVKGMTEWIHKWKLNGWQNAKGLPVVNQELFKRLNGFVAALDQHNGVEVRFLHVPRELNKGADELANRVLDDWEGLATERRFTLKNSRVARDCHCSTLSF
ncbi:hypothetical protein MPH_03880 [Macrophomina phaseolina MS6]|uniref:ribonuclease H n=1 Tax=Macrophomina phaseolina (strain MS6) TaxID=1126212 RepID=K2S8Y9_MACPH|nr:hypothetical protein MPH_03880 [Macrophomina phaseolina MS6]